MATQMILPEETFNELTLASGYVATLARLIPTSIEDKNVSHDDALQLLYLLQDKAEETARLIGKMKAVTA